MEGGSLEGNGQGTLLTTEQCLLNTNRNPGTRRDEIEQCLGDFLGIRKVIWLSGGDLVGDDTDGHIDQLARFTSARTIAVAVEANSSDPNYAALRRNWEELKAATDADGQSFELVPLPLPAPKFFRGTRMPASYLNFYIVNGGILVPQFDDPADETALRSMKDLFPSHVILGLPALDLVWGLGRCTVSPNKNRCRAKRLLH